MPDDIMSIDGHDHAAQSVIDEPAHVFLRPQPAVRADHRMNAALRSITGHCPEIPMNHRFATDKKKITDVILHADVDDVARFLQGHTAPRLRIKLRTGESAEIAVRIADVCDRELKITGPTMIEHFAEQLKRSLARSGYWSQ